MHETLSTERLPSPEQTERFIALGYDVDDMGRPLHPWRTYEAYADLPTDSVLLEWGPNYTGDAIALTEVDSVTYIPLILRGDGSWALPGGFQDASETGLDIATREAGEEIHMELNPYEALPVYAGPVHDPRASQYKWCETSAYAWRRAGFDTNIYADDDANDVQYFTLQQIKEMQLYGSHKDLIALAVKAHGTEAEQLALFDDSNATDYISISGSTPAS